MNKTIRVKLAEYGKVQEFDSGHFVLKKGQRVLVEMEQGLALGTVCSEPATFDREPPARPMNKVYRLASPKDLGKFEKKNQVEKDVYAFCCEKISETSLPMNLVSVDRSYDGSKVIVYFTADRRVDFRELVRDLVREYRTRVEMRQIGVRHQAKMFGGLGTCGRQLCCSSFLSSFAPVSIKMAKSQNLSLNPSKISGMCGRLMCCLTYESAFYEKATKGMPKNGKSVSTIHGKGKIIRHNVLKETLAIILESGEEMEISYNEVIKAKDDNRDKNKEKSNNNSKDKKIKYNSKKNNKTNKQHGNARSDNKKPGNVKTKDNKPNNKKSGSSKSSNRKHNSRKAGNSKPNNNRHSDSRSSSNKPNNGRSNVDRNNKTKSGNDNHGNDKSNKGQNNKERKNP